MLRRILFLLLALAAALTAGWYALQRDDIGYDRLELVYGKPDSRIATLENGLRVHYRDTGPRKAPVIVLVHGFSASLHTWDAWVSDLKRDYRVIALDLPGHGLSTCGDASEIGVDQFVATVDALTTKLGVDRFVLAGNSMGGRTAWSYALAHPQRLDGLVLVDASGWPPEEADKKSEPVVFRLLANPLARRLMKNLDSTMLVRSGLKDSFSDDAFVTEEMVNRYVALGRAPCHRDAIMTLSAARGKDAPATAAGLAAISVPTLILHGEEDNLVPVSAGRKFEAAITGSELVVYPATGHLPQEEVAARSVADLRDFLARRVFVEAEGAGAGATSPNGAAH
ncbi:MAG: alpha/beta hydrolase [Hyphomonas sp.]|uniref:alpha/beta fold hydrolase n=1 Tax=Hyphomonas sp. TaxID=87 RepID=UPI003528E1D5